MATQSWLKRWFGRNSKASSHRERSKGNPARRVRRPRLDLEVLEDRVAPATFHVTGDGDATGPVASRTDGSFTAPTLRAAIDAANDQANHPGLDRIAIEVPADIVLFQTDTTHPFAFGPTAFVVTSDITITNNSHGSVTIDGLNQLRLFGVMPGATLTLQGLTLTGGRAKGGDGGNVVGGTVGGGGGGGAGLGGAIFNAGTLNLLSSTISGNTALGGNGGRVLNGFNAGAGAGGGGAAGGNGGDSGTLGGGGGGGGVAAFGSAPVSQMFYNHGTHLAFGPYTPGGYGGAGEDGSRAAGALLLPGPAKYFPGEDGTHGGGGAGGGHNGTSTSSGGFGGGGGGANDLGAFFGGIGSDGHGGNGGFGAGGGGGAGNFAFSGRGGGGGFGGGGGGAALSPGGGGFGGGPGGSYGGGGGAGMGGGIFNNGGAVTITRSTLSDNSALGGDAGSYDARYSIAGPGRGLGGAIFSNGGTVTITNSTVAANIAKGGVAHEVYFRAPSPGIGQGGGLFNRNGTVTLLNSTFSANQVLTHDGDDRGAALVVTGAGGRQIFNWADGATASVTLNNAILGQSDTDTEDFSVTTSNGGSSVTAGSSNLIRSQSGFSGTVATNADPLLGSLQDNGGSTYTMALAPGSPALDAGTNAGVPATDQRGFARISNGTVDIGAFEVRGTFSIAVSGGNGQSAEINAPFAAPLVVTVSNSAGDPVTGAVITFTAPGSGASLSSAVQTAVLAADGSVTLAVNANSRVGTYNVTVSAAGSSSAIFALTNLPDIAPAVLPQATTARPYSVTLTGTGGTAPYSFAVTEGSLPPGLSLTSAGLLSGTPTEDGVFGFSIAVTDSSGVPGPFVGSHTYTLQVRALQVSTLLDENDGNLTPGHFSLREAIAFANSNADVSTIEFAPELAIEDVGFGPGVIGLSTVGDTSRGPAALFVTTPIIIEGLSGDGGITISRSSTAPNMRLFTVQSQSSLTLHDLTLSNGIARGGNGVNAGGGGAGLGGAIFNQGTLTLVGTTLVGNLAQGGGSPGFGSGAGGGLSGDGTGGAGGSDAGFFGQSGGPGRFGFFGGGGGGGGLGLPNFPGPGGGRGGDGGQGGFGGGGGGGGHGIGGSGDGSGGAGGFGGGSGGSNTNGGGGAGLGGAIYNERGTVIITSSTLTGNVTQGGGGFQGGQALGGAVFNHGGALTIVNSTLTQNTAPNGGRGVYNLGDGSARATATISNTIIGQSDTAVSDFVAAAINGGTNTTSGVGDLIRSAVGFNGTIVTGADPKLGPLADNGGPTKTHAPLSTSPVLDAGDSSVAPADGDQRGFDRVVGAAVDIGAIEFSSQLADLKLSQARLPEDQPAGTSVGTFRTIDLDTTATFTYALVSGDGDDDNASFTVDASGTLRTATPFDFETKSQYSIRVRSTEAGGKSLEKSFVISVTDLADEISGVLLSSATVKPGDAVTIRWIDPAGFVGSVAIDYSTDGGKTFTNIVHSAQMSPVPPGPHADSTTWVVPNHVTAQAQIRIVPDGNPQIGTGYSGLFSIMGPPSAIAVVSGDNQSAQVATPFFNQTLVVRVVDAMGTPVPGVNVTFTSPAVTDGVFFGSFDTTFSTATNSTGEARATLKPGAVAGTYRVAASIAGMPAISTVFTLTNTAGPAHHLSSAGGGQTVPVGEGLATPLSVTVFDQFNNPVPQVTVQFTAPPAGPSGTFGGQASANVVTDARGVATATTFAANSLPGAYAIAAAVAGTSLFTSFSVTNIQLKPTVVAMDMGGVYNGMAYTATATVTGANNAVLASDALSPAVDPGTLSYRYYLASDSLLSTPLGPPVKVGSYQVVAHYTSDQSGYPAADSTPVFFSITAATPVVQVIAAGGTYDASPIAAAVSVAGIDGVFGPSLEGVTPTIMYLDGNADPLVGLPQHVGSYIAVALFSGSQDYANASSLTRFDISPATLTVTAKSVTRTYGDANPSFTATITGFAGDDGPGVVSGTPILSTTATPASDVGGYPIAVAHNLSALDYVFAYTDGTLTINKAALSVSIANATKVYGQDISGTLTGILSGVKNNDPIAATYVSLGSPASAAPGTYEIDAVLSDTGSGKLALDYLLPTQTGTLVVSKDGTTALVTTSAATIDYGQSVKFTATVTANAPGSGTPTGVVSFYDGSTLLGTATLSGGSATLQVAKLGAGTHSITIRYGGDVDFLVSTSAALAQTVLSAAQQTIVVGNQVTNLVSSGVLSSQDASGLTDKLKAAAASFNAGNAKPGVNQMNAFINQVNALVNSRRLTRSQAQALIDAANQIIASAQA